MLIGALTITQAQTNQTKSYQEWIKLLENQKTPLLDNDEEAILIDGTAWQRKYGEKEYVLTPSVPNIQIYQSRIRQLDDKASNIFKSNFHFIKITVNELSKSVLKNANIQIPSYVEGQVNVYLPEIDIDILQKAGIGFNYLSEYGTKIKQKDLNVQKTESPSAIIFTEDFETATIPGAVYSTTIAGTNNCGWQDVSCYKYAGSYSAWCASLGAACNACLGQYVNNMDSYFWKTASINTSSYQNLIFTWWMDYDFNNTGTNDVLYKYWWFGTSWVLSATSYNSSSALDGLLWNQHSASFPGIQSAFDYQFEFYSNSIGTSFGVYLDNIDLSGTSLAGVKEESNNLSSLKIYPNPNNGNFNLQIDTEIENGEIVLFNSLGQKVHEQKVKQGINNINTNAISKGLYNYRLLVNKQPANTGKLSIE